MPKVYHPGVARAPATDRPTESTRTETRGAATRDQLLDAAEVLLLAVYRRRVAEGTAHLLEVLDDPQPLWALWEYNRDPRGTAFTMEFVALANRRPVIRAEIAASASRVREVQVDALGRILARYGIARRECPPLVASVLLSSVSRYLVLEEQALGIIEGHDQTVRFVEGFLRRYEGARRG